MTRDEFLGRLRSGLSRLPEEDLNDALNYYNEIFLDAGLENEEETARKLGNVEGIIQQIYIENGIEIDARPEFIMENVIDNRGSDFSDSQTGAECVSSGLGVLPLMCKVIILVVLLPIWLPLVVTVFVIAFVLCLLGISMEFVLGVVGVSFAAVGLGTAFSAPPYGFVMAGAGLICLGIFSLTATAAVKGAWHGVVKLANRAADCMHSFIFGRRS